MKGNESPKINVIEEEDYSYDEESIINLAEKIEDDYDEDYTPQPETR